MWDDKGPVGDFARSLLPFPLFFPQLVPWPLRLSPDLSAIRDGFFHISRHHPKYNNQKELEKNKSMSTNKPANFGESNLFVKVIAGPGAGLPLHPEHPWLTGGAITNSTAHCLLSSLLSPPVFQHYFIFQLPFCFKKGSGFLMNSGRLLS